jgi:hypothetical protein
MPCQGQGHAVVGRLGDGAGDRRDGPDLEVVDFAVDEMQDLVGRQVEQRVRA